MRKHLLNEQLQLTLGTQSQLNKSEVCDKSKLTIKAGKMTKIGVKVQSQVLQVL
jgi:hypothetical protein